MPKSIQKTKNKLPQNANQAVAIVFFDGECGLCRSSVRFFIKHDKKRALRYASLQSPLGQTILKQAHLPSEPLNTLILQQCALKSHNNSPHNIPPYPSPHHKSPYHNLSIKPTRKPKRKPKPTLPTLLLRSEALLAALDEFSWPWRFLAQFLRMLPLTWRNKGYDVIARHRKRLPYFNRACRVPTPAERTWFIDF